MQFLKRNPLEVAACLAIALLGAVATAIGFGYGIGSLTRMEPGFFPVVAGLAIVGLAIAAAVETTGSETAGVPLRFRPTLSVGLSILAWTFMVEPFGLVPATLALIILSALARRPFRPVSLLLLAAGLCLGAYLVFIDGLGMPLTLFGR